MNPPLSLSPSEKLMEQVLAFCLQISSEEPGWVEVAICPGATPLNCYQNVQRLVSCSGGQMILGWEISETPGLFLEAEHHAIWQDPHGGLTDVTPAPVGSKPEHIFFLPDFSKSVPPQTIPNRQLFLSKEGEDYHRIAKRIHQESSQLSESEIDHLRNQLKELRLSVGG